MKSAKEQMPGRKVGREWKFSRSALVHWIGSGRSEQFYRDDEGGEIVPVRPAEQDGANGADPKPAEARRRTVGWRLDYD